MTDKLESQLAAIPQGQNRRSQRAMKVLYNFSWHGLGDIVQFACVLRHLKYYFSNRKNFVRIPERSRVIVADDADMIEFVEYINSDPPKRGYDLEVNVDWAECYKLYPNSPSTKTVAFLRDIEHIEPVKEVLRYRVIPTEYDLETIAPQIKPWGRYAIFHYKGRTNPAAKDLSEDLAHMIEVELENKKLTPVVPEGNDVGELIAYMSKAAVNVCIDSGPQKIAFALADQGGPPCVAIWTGHHPIHYCDYAKNTIHIIPVNHHTKVRGDWSICKDFFEANYRYMTYSNVRELVSTIGRAVGELLK